MELSIKKAIIPALVTFGIILSPLTALANQGGGAIAPAAPSASYTESTIVVSASGSAKVKPDRTTVSIGFETRSKTLKEANEKTQQFVKEVVQSMAKFGLTEKDVVSSYWSWYPNLNYDENGKTSIMDFTSSRSISINFQEMFEDTDLVINALPTVDGVNLTSASVEYKASTEGSAAGYEEARKSALTKVKEKAASLAKDLGVTLGRLLKIEDSNNPYEVWASNPDEANIEYYLSATYAFN